jgi:hypothetical protein
MSKMLHDTSQIYVRFHRKILRILKRTEFIFWYLKNFNYFITTVYKLFPFRYRNNNIVIVVISYKVFQKIFLEGFVIGLSVIYLRIC